MLKNNAAFRFASVAILLSLTAVGVPAGHAQTPPQTQTQAQPQTYQVDTVLAKMAEGSQSLKTMAANLERKTANALVPDERKDPGQIWIVKQAKDTRVRIDFTSAKEIWLVDKGKMLLYDQRSKSASRYALAKATGQVGALTSFVMLGFGQASSNVTKDYTPTLLPSEVLDAKDGKKYVVLDLKPKAADVLKMFSSIRLWLDTDTWSPVQTRITETSGDTQTIRFTSIKRNGSISDSVFNLNLPKDVKITDR